MMMMMTTMMMMMMMMGFPRARYQCRGNVQESLGAACK